MRSLGSQWNTLAADDSAVLQSKVVINNVEYTAITTPIVNQSLLSSEDLTVGNCFSASLKFTVKTNNTIPKSATVVLKCRYVKGSTTTSWFDFGTFFVSKREVDDDMVTLECYDAMLKGNQAYGGSSDALNWPKPMQTVLNTIASRLGVSLDSRNSIRSDSTNYKCEYPGELTLLQVLGYIGACNGGNWIITHENKLRLVPLGGSGSSMTVPVVLSQITTGKAYSISGVTMSIDKDHVYSAGNTSGYVLTIDSNPYANQTITNNLYNALNGLTYQPFTISGAIYNPAAELGDTVVVGSSLTSVLITETRSYDIGFRVDAEAPAKDELNDEYPYPSKIQQLQRSTVQLQQNDEVLSSRITQTQTSIETEVTRATTAEGTLSSRITQNATDISSEVTRASTAEGNLSSRITQNATSITSEVTRATTAEGTLSSRITQNATDIGLRVEKSGVIAAINLSTESSGGSTVKISADKVNLSGYATFTSLSTSGQSTINGSNITTGTIKDASSNTVFNLSTGELTMKKGSINLGSGKFTVSNAGAMSCSSATILSTNSSGYWMEYGSTHIKCGYTSGSTRVNGAAIYFGSYTSAYNDLALTSDDYITLDSGYCIQLEADYSIHLYANGITIADSSWGTQYYGYSGRIDIVTSIWDNGNGVSWTTDYWIIKNGLVTTSA